MKIVIIIIFVIVTSTLFNKEVDAIDIKGGDKEFYLKMYYSGDYSNLHGNALAGHEHGWNIKDSKVSSVGSRAGFDLKFKKKWNISLDTYSSDSLLPTNIGQEPEDELSLRAINILLGYLDNDEIPKIKFSRTEFLAKGEVNGTATVISDGKLLSDGDEFDLALIYDTYQFVWDMKKVLEHSVFFENSKTGIGMARMQFLGTEIEEDKDGTVTKVIVEKELEQYGILFSFNTEYVHKEPIFSSTHVFFNDIVIFSMTSSSQVFKVGYDLGLVFIDQPMTIKSYIGGYGWVINNENRDFDAIVTDLGYSAGLQFEYLF